MTLAEFLLARIAEDEAGGVHATECGYAQAEFGDPCSCGWDVRVLAECEAKRRIVEGLTPALLPLVLGDGSIASEHFVLRHLAAVYADHPDYREEWKP